MSELQPVLELHGVSKRFPGTLAVDRVDLDFRAGEVHAVIGENGAGKSTLMNLIAGAFADYTGEVRIHGQPVRLHTPAVARAHGIAMIHQELSLAPPLSVAENVLAGRLPTRGPWLDRRQLRAEARQWLACVGLELDPDTPVEAISQHEAQRVEIAKALSNRPALLVMDEPTSALSRAEVSRLFEIIREFKASGLAIVYISHHLPEVFEIADRVSVMRDGRRVATRPIDETHSRELVELMIGGAESDLFAPRGRQPGQTALRVRGLSRIGFFQHCSFTVGSGEVLGLAGLSGAGRSELARSLCGIDPVDAGTVTLHGREVEPDGFPAAIRAGFAYLTEDRKRNGLAQRLTVAENLLAAVIPRYGRAGFYRHRAGQRLAHRLVKELSVQPPDPEREIATLSGGNQQKVLLAKWLATDPEVLVLDEPTRGVDIGAKAIIHRAIAAVADRGKCVILISSDLPELVGLSDRILVMRRGRLLGEMPAGRCNEETVLLAANGEFPDLLPVKDAPEIPTKNPAA